MPNTDDDSPTPPRDASSQVKKALSLTLLALVIIFIVQNLASVEVDFLFWTMRMPRAVLVALLVLVGFSVGMLFDRASTRGRSRDD